MRRGTHTTALLYNMGDICAPLRKMCGVPKIITYEGHFALRKKLLLKKGKNFTSYLILAKSTVVLGNLVTIEKTQTHVCLVAGNFRGYTENDPRVC